MATHAGPAHEARAYEIGPSEAPDYAGQQLPLQFDVFFPYTYAAWWWGARKEEGLGFQRYWGVGPASVGKVSTFCYGMLSST